MTRRRVYIEVDPDAMPGAIEAIEGKHLIFVTVNECGAIAVLATSDRAPTDYEHRRHIQATVHCAGKLLELEPNGPTPDVSRN